MPVVESSVKPFGRECRTARPWRAVRAAAAEGLDHEQAAERFVVSDVAMRWRYFNLGINT